MRNEGETAGPAAGATKPRLPARVFYGVIAAGVVVGALATPAAVWLQLEYGDQSWRGALGDLARVLALPVSAMMGATFGGLAGVALAVVLGRRGRGSGSPGPDTSRSDS